MVVFVFFLFGENEAQYDTNECDYLRLCGVFVYLRVYMKPVFFFRRFLFAY